MAPGSRSAWHPSWRPSRLAEARARDREETIGIHVARREYTLTLRGAARVLGRRTWIMGVLNATPDSFSDGGRFGRLEDALAQGFALFEAGADVVDVGGESTRPGAERVPANEERRRVVPVIEALRKRGAGLISIDTTRAEVAEAALDAGADIVNDVSALRFDEAMGPLVARAACALVLMHSRGSFETLHQKPSYADVGRELVSELRSTIERAVEAGIAGRQLIVDPGLGFAKDAGHSLEALRRLDELVVLDRPVLVGPSRKSFIGRTLDRPVEERLMGTAAATAAAVLGGAHIVRLHDVAALGDIVRLTDALRGTA